MQEAKLSEEALLNNYFFCGKGNWRKEQPTKQLYFEL